MIIRNTNRKKDNKFIYYNKNLNQSKSMKDSMEELEVYGDVPLPRFGHSITVVSKAKVVLFGGATGDTGRYSMTGDTYSLNLAKRCWTKLNGNN